MGLRNIHKRLESKWLARYIESTNQMLRHIYRLDKIGLSIFGSYKFYIMNVIEKTEKDFLYFEVWSDDIILTTCESCLRSR